MSYVKFRHDCRGSECEQCSRVRKIPLDAPTCIECGGPTCAECGATVHVSKVIVDDRVLCSRCWQELEDASG